MIYTGKYTSPFGSITMAGNGRAITGLWFEGQRYFGANLPKENKPEELPVFEETRRWLDIYFQGKEPGFRPELAFGDTPFRMAVWEILLTIPYGKTMTYGAIAKHMAKKLGVPHMSAQAVGGAVGRNPISILVPCHRVVGVNGSLTGYAGGIEKKRELLKLEKVDLFRSFTPN